MGETKKTHSALLQEKIVESNAIISSIGDHVVGLVIVDKNGKIQRINQGFEALTGWQEKEVIGKVLIKILPRKEKNLVTVPFKNRILSKILAGKVLTTAAAGDNGMVASIEKIPTFYYVRKDKTKFPVSSVITPLLLDNKVTGAVEVFYDITKEKELEQMRLDFLSLAAHQLRTPLSGTKWLIETLHSGILGDVTKKQKEYIGDVYKINEQMICLVSDILSTLRLESDETLLKKEKISVAALCKDVIVRVKAAAKGKNIKLQIPLNHRTLTIETDSELVKSILGCFLSNAIDYSRPGQKVILDIKQESGKVIFFVRDFGIGIPRVEHKRIFQRFYRASNAKNFKPTGTGLGLNIARTLAEKVGAEISFESKKDKGSTFYLQLPKVSTMPAKKMAIKSKKY